MDLGPRRLSDRAGVATTAVSSNCGERAHVEVTQYYAPRIGFRRQRAAAHGATTICAGANSDRTRRVSGQADVVDVVDERTARAVREHNVVEVVAAEQKGVSWRADGG